MTAIKNPMTRLGVASSAVLLALGGEAFAASELKSDDFVGISFWLISMASSPRRLSSFWKHNALLESGKPR
jgi:hypothetical protein